MYDNFGLAELKKSSMFVADMRIEKTNMMCMMMKEEILATDIV